jgi:type II secretory pathway component GspD/PulD (secretin)
MKLLFRSVCFALLAQAACLLHGQTIRKMDFRNQNITDILMALADMGQQSIVIDPSVSGVATFYFTDSEFEDALNQFIDACNLYYEKKYNAYYVSKMQILQDGDLITIAAEDVDIELLIRNLSRTVEKTVLYDALPRAQVSIHSQNISLRDLLELAIKRYPDYSVVEENSAFYIRRSEPVSSNAAGRLSSSSIRKEGELFSMDIQRASFSAIVALLFKTAEKEYSLLQRIDATIDNLYFENKSFEQLLRLVLEQGNCDYIESEGIWYIYEVQRRDILKNYKTAMVIQLQYINVEEAVALLPSDFNGSSFIKINRERNTAYLSGSTEEIQPVATYLAMLDIAPEDKTFKVFDIKYLKASDVLALLPRELSAASPQLIPDSNSFIAELSEAMITQFEDFIKLVDKRNAGMPVRLKYIRGEELLQNLPPSVLREEIALSSDPTLVFYRSTEEKQQQFLEHLELVDQPKPQIRYQLLVIQYQRSNNLNYNKSFTASIGGESSDEESNDGYTLISGAFSNLVNIGFDIVSGFGEQFSMQLNLQLGEDRAKVMADTTLNGISGQDIKFENTNTFRYRDTTIDPETGKPFYTGTTREITSGIVLGINGWVSGDGMITMSVNAAVSKQDESGANTSATTNPPPTSERVVNTQVRTKSGTPVVIGGLLQIEKMESVRKIPILGSIPLLGKLFQDIDTSDITTEMVIYIIPFVHNGDHAPANLSKVNENYYKKYVLREL